MATSLVQLTHWLCEPEGERLEFKEARQNYHFEKLVEYCVALANEGGGKMIFGVTDLRPRRIVGSAAFAEPGRTSAGLYERLQRRIPVEELMTPDGRVVIVHVPSRLPGGAWQFDGRFLKRAGDGLVPMNDGELQAIFAEVGPDFSSLVCDAATMSDLAPIAINDFRDRWARKQNDVRIRLWDSEQTLQNAELLIDGKVTNAALILFGSKEVLGRYLPQAEIVFEYRSSEASGPAASRSEFREGFFMIYDELWRTINLRNDRQSFQDGLFRVEIPTFDEVPVREALLNAIAHRDYRLGGSVFVRQFVRRLEIVSPGGLPAGITPENIVDQQNPRNRRLAEALGRCGLIERSGQGMNLIFETAIRYGKPLPNFAGTAAHETRLTLEGGVESPGFLRFMERLGEKTLQQLSTSDFLVLNCVHRELPVPEHLKSRLPLLVSAGAVELIGRGKGARYLLSQSLYAAIGQKGTATRKRGLDTETKKELLLKHLRIQGESGAPLSELCQVLPAESVRAVQLLLDSLRSEGRIGLFGQRRWARWIALAKSDLEPSK